MLIILFWRQIPFTAFKPAAHEPTLLAVMSAVKKDRQCRPSISCVNQPSMLATRPMSLALARSSLHGNYVT